MLGTGATWPANGEIDVIEGISLNTNNLMSLHTSSGCTFTKQTQYGPWVGGDCYGADNNGAGCGTNGNSSTTYGAGWNAAGGGLYVVEWTSAFIKVWIYPKNMAGGLPADLVNGAPDQTKRGEPHAYWLGSSSCTIDNHFKNQQIILNINFCGDWAGQVWSTTAGCSTKATTCVAYVAKNPSAFNGVKWEVNSIKVYQQSTTTKRGIVDDALNWERSLLGLEPLAHGVEEIEQGSVEEVVEVREVPAVAKSHLHRHKHRSERLV